MSERNSRASWAKKKVLIEDVPPDYIYVSFWEDRSCMNILCRIIYTLIRGFNVVFMFYFFPHLGLFSSFNVPYFMKGYWY